jgi:uncharacterized membrane protein
VIPKAFAGPRRWLAWTFAVAPLYVLSCIVAEGGLADARPWGDVGQYERYGELTLDGEVPYHDFYMEYPPGALVAFVPPAVFVDGHSHYLWTFKLLMTLGGIVALALMARALAELGAESRRLGLALGAFAVAPVALGHIFLNRYDIWPALLTVAALTSLLVRREIVAAGILAVGFAVKLFAAALAPVTAIRIWRTKGRACLGRAVLCSVSVSVLIFSPFLLMAFGGLGNSYYTQFKRSLQIESVGASFLLVADQLGIYATRVTTDSPGSLDVGGWAPDVVGTVTTLLQVAAILLVAGIYWRGPETDERLVTAFAATVAAFVVFGKVLSPQFLIWLLPVVPLVRGAGGRLATAGLLVALVITQIEQHGFAGFAISDWAIWTLLARNVLLVAVFGVLLWQLRSGESSSRRAATR